MADKPGARGVPGPPEHRRRPRSFSRASSRRFRTGSMWKAVFAIAALYVGSTILTPLYPLYQSEFGFSELTVAEIYAVYALGNLAVLFLFGRLSDQLGRRRVTLAALAITGLSAGCFLLAASKEWLFGARVLNGFAVGLGAAALTAWIAELEPDEDRARAATVTSAGNLAGLGFGALAGGLLAGHLPGPLQTGWILCLAVSAGAFLILRSVPETVDREVDRLAEVSLRPRIGVPQGLRLAFVGAGSLAFASFALGGFYAALIPGLLTQRIGQTSVAVIGMVVALFFGTAAIAAVMARRWTPRVTLLGAIGLLLAGLGLLLVADARRSFGWLLLATLGGGVAMALRYRGSLQVVDEIAPPDRRAELLASFLLVCYTANALPIVGVGLLSRAAGAETAHRVFAGVLGLLGLTAGAIGLTRRRGVPQV